MKNGFYRFSLFSLITLLSGCTEIGPNYTHPKLDLPEKWSNSSGSALTPTDVSWWKNFHDPLLNKLILESISENLELKQAFARMKSFQALYRKAQAALWPTIDAVGSENQNKSSLNYLPGYPPYYKAYTTGVTTNWEIDLFGRIRRAEEAADALFEMTINDARGVFISLISDVAQTYITLRRDQQNLKIALKRVETLSQLYALSTDLYKAGKVSDLIVQENKIALDKGQSEIPPLQAQIDLSIHHLSILAGKSPSELVPLLSSPQPIPSASLSIFSGLPSDLLQRRPDIKQAENQLQSSTAEIGIAMGDLFPTFSLTGNFIYETTSGASSLFSYNSSSYSIGPQFTWPIIDFGAVRANIDSKIATRDESFYAYKETVLKAFEEVENALITLSTENQRHISLEEAVERKKVKDELIFSKYKAGLIDYSSSLQETLLFLDLLHISQESQAQVSLDIVNLYKVLGGGWERYFPEVQKEMKENS